MLMPRPTSIGSARDLVDGVVAAVSHDLQPKAILVVIERRVRGLGEDVGDDALDDSSAGGDTGCRGV